MKRIDESVVPGSSFIHFQIQPCKSKVSLNFNNGYLSKINIWITALAMNLHPTYDLEICEWNLCMNSCFWSWTARLPESGLWQTDLHSCCLTHTYSKQKRCCQPLPLPSGPTTWAQAQHFWSKLVQILMPQITGSINAYDLPHLQTANQTWYPY